MPERISTVINPVSGHSRNFTWEYTYDANGNIINETIPGSIDSTDYYYDEAGQLLEAINLTWDTYAEYDNGGNVTYKYVIWTASDGENGFEEEYNFEYGNANWPDQLTKVNDKLITYDAIGNPLTYDGKTYTWTAGRELASIVSEDMSLAFKYNDSGLRTHKTVTQNSVTTAYTYAWSQDGRLISQTDGTTTLYFIYDENNEIIGFAKLTADTSEFYYYVKNLQGDVYAIVDSNGTVVAEYLYDAWGYLLKITGSQADTIGVLNPIRYRGYYYDTETGYYYLQSRYYDPVWGRFINADEYVNTGLTSSGTNMFAYCENDPINKTDPSGKVAISTAAFFLTAALLLAVVSVSGYNIILNSFNNSFSFQNQLRNNYYKFSSPIYTMSGKISLLTQTVKTFTKIAVKFMAASITVALADAKIRSKVTQKSKTRYWTATWRTTYVDIGRGLSFSEAKKEVSLGRNVFTVTKAEAKALAKSAFGGKKPEGPQKHGGDKPGYYWHFHPYRRNNAHVWYLF